MHLPSDTPYLRGLTATQRFCVEIWHGQTFSSSLDSYRVRLHNGRTILKELLQEIQLQIAKGADLQVIALEALELCRADMALQACLGRSFQFLVTALNELSTDKLVTEGKTSIWSMSAVKKVRYLLEDALKRTEKDYLYTLFRLVPESIRNDVHPFERIESAVSSLLTDLVDRGWVLESLHEWSRNLAGYVVKNRSFDERFLFLEQQIMRDPQPFTVCLRLFGSPSLSELGSFKGWHFSATGPQLLNPPREIEVYTSPKVQTSFAHCQINAVDFKSACHAALETFEGCLDRLRFNFLDTKIELDTRMLIIRDGDRRPRLERVTFPVPNPVFTRTLAEFRQDSERIDELLRKDTLDRTARERITAAGRHYRLGQDAGSYRDKLLNWWFGLEYLTKITNQGSIGEAVFLHGKNCMMARYFLLLLHDIEPSLRQALGEWPPSVVALLSCGLDERLQEEKLLRVMQDPACCGDIESLIGASPWLLVRFQELASILSDPTKLALCFKQHEQRVEWQLKRLYRVRCCLVHGSPTLLRLMLLCANLEFYLRETMMLMIRTMLLHQQVTSLTDFYDRLNLALQRQQELLKAATPGASPPPASILDGIVTFS